MSVIALMGSGELSPTMVGTHREILNGRPDRVTFIDTPYGFQENADELTAKVEAYFATSLRATVDIASLREAGAASIGDIERMLDQVRTGSYIFSGPGSPSYALAQWAQIGFSTAVETCLANGGAITLASAAAITAGSHAVPVYEIYKVGAPSHWLPGLDLLGLIGIDAAVIPHFNNTEGGTHDTRFCYLGQKRLDQMIELLPATTAVLGVDEHTGLLIDTEAGEASVTGKGTVTFLSGESATVFASGERLAISALQTSSPRPTSLPEAGQLASFEEALEAGDAQRATDLIVDEADESVQRTMIVRLGQAASVGLENRADIVAPLVDALVELRHKARSESRWEDGDAIRKVLDDYHVTVTDTSDGTVWSLP